MTRKYGIAVAALAVALPASATAAEAREPVTRAAVSAVAQRLAAQSATGLEKLTNGGASVDRSQTSVSNYRQHGKFRMGASFVLFGTNTVDGQVGPLRCVGTVELAQGKTGRARVAANLTCPSS